MEILLLLLSVNSFIVQSWLEKILKKTHSFQYISMIRKVGYFLYERWRTWSAGAAW